MRPATKLARMLRIGRIVARHLRVNPTDPAVVVQFEIYFTHYNFVRIHQTLKITPAMAAGVTTKLLSDMVKVLRGLGGRQLRCPRRELYWKSDFNL
jgi:hypothetical protein